MKGALRGDRLEDSPMQNSAVGYKPTVPFRKIYGGSAGTNLNMTTFLFGPHFTRRGKNVTWFAQSLYGYSYINADGDIFGPEIGRGDTSFAFAPGGVGIDVRLSEKIALRVFQFDLLFTNLGRGGGQIHPRVSTGVVLRLGRQ